MKVLLVGANGTVGSAAAAALEDQGHEVVRASRSGQVAVDISDPHSIRSLYQQVGQVDAVACAAGATPFKSITEATRDDVIAGLHNKLLDQIELVRQGLDHVADGGSFTLISGILSEDPIPAGSIAGTVNGGLDAFVRATAIELPRGLRINSVSPTVLSESWEKYGPSFPGFRPVPATEVGRAYVKSVDGAQTGQTYRVGW
ncbi:short chain dehydrogenase [Nocardioides sp.]|uniref:short chain dehydrogenase n=1 Tax=Nocardioides sp. TaxID=35761 RepID=UPI00198F342D|nr:short chain dehydrogenase [Nocardioides sp.]MBC7277625.1 short chain dehydrogenase [Nocardioides sp.]